MVRRRLLLAAAAVLAALAVSALALALLRPPPPSDEERVRVLFVEAARAVEARQPREAVRGVSERFQGGGLDRDGLRRLIAVEGLRGVWTSVAVAGAAVRVDGDGASAMVDLVAARGGAGRALADLLPTQASAWRVDATLEREREGWRVTAATWREIPLAEALAGTPPPAGR